MPARRSVDLTQLQAELAQVGTHAGSVRVYRERVLELLATSIDYDAALFHALSPRVPLDTAAFRGLDPARIAASQHTWDDLAVELGALRDAANREFAASIDSVFTPTTTRHKHAVSRLHALFGMRSMCVLHLVVRGQVGSAIVLLARRARAFDDGVLGVLRGVGPVLALADRMHELLDQVPRASAPVQLHCLDERLTARQREIVERVALGHSNEQIAAGLGLSANTVRNHLARVFARVGSSNRADLVRLAVLRPMP